jgi:hypothetical protein
VGSRRAMAAGSVRWPRSGFSSASRRFTEAARREPR